MTPAQAVDPLEILRRFAPGTPLRNAVELILRQRTGALILLAPEDRLDNVCSGGFQLRDAKFSAQRIAELAKMDAGIVLSEDASEILRANVQFIPRSSLPTSETGTRFRTAERLARQTGSPVLAVSEEGRAVAVVFAGDARYELRSPATLHAEGNQNLLSLERLRRRLQDAENRLTRLEVDDVVTVRDVVLLLQRAALVSRLGSQVDRIVVELGGAGHLISVQAADLMDGVEELAQLVYVDYAKRRTDRSVFSRLEQVPMSDLHDAQTVSDAVGFGPVDTAARPRGARILARVPSLPEGVKDSLLSHFKSFPRLLNATVSDLAEVEGVGRTRGQHLRSYLDRLQQHGTPFAITD
jgi:diadenylate cyclase